MKPPIYDFKNSNIKYSNGFSLSIYILVASPLASRGGQGMSEKKSL